MHHQNFQNIEEKFLPSGENGLPSARYRMGLSATPEHYIDTDKNIRLNEFYGSIVHTYTLKQAIEDEVLTPYCYHPKLVELTDEEAEEFVELSDEIGQLWSRYNGKSEDTNRHLKTLQMKRARLIGSATNKLPTLRNLLNSQNPTKHTLFYCSDGNNEGQRQIEAVSELLHEIGWSLSRFTYRENKSERERILENFRGGIIDAMVAIKCLDEGIDIPACDSAYILASSQNPREFVQRRGRILRRAPGKEQAVIHDLIVTLPEDYLERTKYAKNQIKNELKRVATFSALSENRPETYETLAPVLRKYDLEYII